MLEELLELNQELSQTHRELIRTQRELKPQRDRLERESTTDELTGLRNRRFVLERLKVEMARAERNDVPLAVVTFDVDQFKAVNDTFGHAAGDDALKAVADVCRSASRAYDVVGRMGGDEFVAVLPDAALAEAVALAKRLCVGVRDVEVPGAPPGLTSSFGATSRRSGDDLHALLRRADRALYRAKRAGGNRVHAIAEEDATGEDT
jgi:diguanylate cyclase (GGDEF)-like protein